MPKPHKSGWYRDKVARLARLLATEDHYAPYSDADLAEQLRCSVGLIRYYRVNYFQLGNTLERRADYLKLQAPDGRTARIDDAQQIFAAAKKEASDA